MERKIVCCIYNGDDPVTQEKELTLNSADATNLNNRVYEVTLNLNKSISANPMAAIKNPFVVCKMVSHTGIFT